MYDITRIKGLFCSEYFFSVCVIVAFVLVQSLGSLSVYAYRNQNITICVFKHIETMISELLAVMNSYYGLISEE